MTGWCTLSLLRAAGWTNIADPLRHHDGTAAERALALIGALPAGL